MSLAEDLQALSDAVPTLGQNVAEALRGAEALQAAAQELLNEVAAARDEAATELTAVQDALPGVAVQAEANEKSLRASGTEVADAWQEGASELETNGEQVANRVDDVVSQIHGLREILAEAGTKVDQSQAVGEEALRRLQHDAQEASQRLHAALQAMQAEVGSFHSFADAARQQLTAAAQALWSRLQAISSDAESGAQEALEAFRAKAGEYKEAAQGFVSGLSQEIVERVDAAGEQLDRDVAATVTDAAAALRDELERLAASAGKQEAALARHGQALDAALDQAKGELGPVRAGIGQIQEAARRAGLSPSEAKP